MHSTFHDVRFVPLGLGAERVGLQGTEGAGVFELKSGEPRVRTGRPEPQEVARFMVFPDGVWAIVTPDGLYTGSAGADQFVRVFKDGQDVTDPEWLRSRRQPAEIRKRLRAWVLNPEEGGAKPAFSAGKAAPPAVKKAVAPPREEF